SPPPTTIGEPSRWGAIRSVRSPISTRSASVGKYTHEMEAVSPSGDDPPHRRDWRVKKTSTSAADWTRETWGQSYRRSQTNAQPCNSFLSHVRRSKRYFTFDRPVRLMWSHHTRHKLQLITPIVFVGWQFPLC